MRIDQARASLRVWTRRLWGALRRTRSDDDLQRELSAHVELAEDELRRKGHAPRDAARIARATAGGSVQALEAMRDQRGLPWIDASLLDARLGLRLLVRNWGLSLVGGLAMSVTIAIAAIVFAAFDVVLWSRLPLDDGEKVVAIQVWDREAGRRRDTTWQDFERWRGNLQSIDEVGAFQAIRRNVMASDGSIELASIAEISANAFQIARVQPILGRSLTDGDGRPGAPAVIVIGHDVWQRRFGGAPDVIGRELELDTDVHTVIGVMPAGVGFPLNFRYWIPLRRDVNATLRNTGPEGAVFGRLTDGSTLARAHAEVSALGIVSTLEGTGARVVPYTFAFTGDFEPGSLGLAWSLSSVLLVLLLVPPCANIAILNYARIITRQQEFAARHALGGSRARIVSQLFIEALLLTAGAAGIALLILRVALVVVAERLQNIPGGPPFWMTFAVSYRTLLFVALLAVIGAVLSGLVPALQATRRVSQLGTNALAGRVTMRLGATWTLLVVAQVSLSVAVLPLAAELAWGTVRSGVIGPGFVAEDFATARIAPEPIRQPELARNQQREVSRRLLDDPAIVGVATALQPPGDEPWVFVEIEGRDAPSELLNGRLPGFLARFNQVDAAFFDLYQVPALAGRRFSDADVVASGDAVVINRNFAETIAPGANALGHRFRYVRTNDDDLKQFDRWYEVVGVVGNLPATTDARVAYHAIAADQLWNARLQLHLRGDVDNLDHRIRRIAASVDPTLHVDDVRTLAEIYRAHRFGDNVGAIVIAAVTLSVVLLSGAGLYALMAFTVAQRRREIGIRSALGAHAGQLMLGVFRRALWQIGAGAAIGMLAAYVVRRYVPIEQVGGLTIRGILPAAAAFMLLVGVLASSGPARRGLRIDPVEALRSE